MGLAYTVAQDKIAIIKKVCVKIPWCNQPLTIYVCVLACVFVCVHVFVCVCICVYLCLCVFVPGLYEYSLVDTTISEQGSDMVYLSRARGRYRDYQERIFISSK